MGIHHKASKRKIAFAKRLRRKQTRAEKAFWQIAREIREEIGTKFWRQTVILGWIVDFWCPKLKLVVEIDGPSHEEQKDYDEHRALVMEQELEITTVRFSNFDVINNAASVKAKMLALIERIDR